MLPGFEHAGFRCVFFRLLLLLHRIFLLLPPTFLLQRRSPLLPLPLPAKVLTHSVQAKKSFTIIPMSSVQLYWFYQLPNLSVILMEKYEQHPSVVSLLRHYAPKSRRRESATKKVKTQWTTRQKHPFKTESTKPPKASFLRKTTTLKQSQKKGIQSLDDWLESCGSAFSCSDVQHIQGQSAFRNFYLHFLEITGSNHLILAWFCFLVVWSEWKFLLN